MFAAPVQPEFPYDIKRKKYEPKTPLKKPNWKKVFNVGLVTRFNPRYPQLTPTKVAEDSIWIEVKSDDQFVGEDVFDSLSHQFSSDPRARVQKEVSAASDRMHTIQKKTKELKVLDQRAAQNLCNTFSYLLNYEMC